MRGANIDGTEVVPICLCEIGSKSKSESTYIHISYIYSTVL